MVSAVTRVGEAIASAAGVVIAAFLALLASTLSVLRSMGPALAIAVAVTLIAGLTLIPADKQEPAGRSRRPASTLPGPQGNPGPTTFASLPQGIITSLTGPAAAPTG
jgi:RND superfamily putative drug exporter